MILSLNLIIKPKIQLCSLFRIRNVVIDVFSEVTPVLPSCKWTTCSSRILLAVVWKCMTCTVYNQHYITYANMYKNMPVPGEFFFLLCFMSYYYSIMGNITKIIGDISEITDAVITLQIDVYMYYIWWQ